MSFKVRKYLVEDKLVWDPFVAQAKNATFLFQRDFMDYHKDRFVDHSLLVFKKNKLVAVFPATLVKNQIISHAGLTYGGLVVKKDLKLKELLLAFQAVLKYYHEHGIAKLSLKQIPSIYTSYPSEGIEYAAFIFKAIISRVDVSSAIDLSLSLKIQKNRIEGVKKAQKQELMVKEESSFKAFWEEILTPNLTKRYDAKPVHSLTEITRLQKYFPKNIKQFNVYHKDKSVAGATIFEMPHLVHVQYIASNDNRQQLGALDFLFHYLIKERYVQKRYFDFGTSNEQQGHQLNEGLLYWKECFGARTVVHRFFDFETANYPLLDNVWM